ncbi:hypothetical protein [Lacticaseibacillus kribbianus]|uniref:hypothetical protein n=1 Tax=Lacticaseibacillus kribbianus TaxID=2926292 RepID=UPI001CD3A534|nr:hypothetical protein [Lacticaseibacillus kribbianus]
MHFRHIAQGLALAAALVGLAACSTQPTKTTFVEPKDPSYVDLSQRARKGMPSTPPTAAKVKRTLEAYYDEHMAPKGKTHDAAKIQAAFLKHQKGANAWYWTAVLGDHLMTTPDMFKADRADITREFRMVTSGSGMSGLQSEAPVAGSLAGTKDYNGRGPDNPSAGSYGIKDPQKYFALVPDDQQYYQATQGVKFGHPMLIPVSSKGKGYFIVYVFVFPQKDTSWQKLAHLNLDIEFGSRKAEDYTAHSRVDPKTFPVAFKGADAQLGNFNNNVNVPAFEHEQAVVGQALGLTKKQLANPKTLTSLPLLQNGIMVYTKVIPSMNTAEYAMEQSWQLSVDGHKFRVFHNQYTTEQANGQSDDQADSNLPGDGTYFIHAAQWPDGV